ncbi:MAG TPA: isoprenylcysteine carboxylmethyltransferase family protein [Vicinamibacterales bacterium]|nr:isoprenylcysteine carboxylmethyltransferase family protein [Vicinamibacterales bacterium]
MPEATVTVMDFLARFRVALGWVFAPLVFILANPSIESIFVGTLVGLVGEGIRIWAAGHVNKAREVTTSGPYRYVAHPLYVGSSVMGAGLAIASANPLAAALIALYLAVTLRAAVRSEEAFLRRAFGDQYDLYRRQRSADNGRRFSLAQAMANREHRAVTGLLAAMLLLALKATYNGAFWRAAAGQ